MKLFFLILVAGFIPAGLIIPVEQLAITGAVLFLIVEVFDLVSFYREAKLCRDDKWHEEEKNLLEKITDWLRNVIVLGSLGLAVVGITSGWIIWGAVIVGYLIAGFITRSVANIPLRMTPGDYKVDRRRKR